MTQENKPESPLDLLRPYQREILTDPAQFKLLLCARQSGKSTVLACEAVRDCCYHAGSRWLCVSAGNRQSQELLSKMKNWAQLWCKYLFANNVPLRIEKATQSEICFSNGSRILALPPNPDTVRGYTANIILDEFAFVENDKELWDALLPSVTLGQGGVPSKVRVASTPSGKNTKFWKLAEDADKPGSHWHKYVIDIHKAIADGLKANADKLHKNADSEESWRREYLCDPEDDESSTLLPLELIKSCESDDAKKDLAPGTLEQPGMRYVLGVDVARVKDFSVLWFLKIEGTGLWTTVGVVELPHIQLSSQQDIIAGYLRRSSVEKCYIDSGGMGTQMSENLVKEFGAKVTPFTFTVQSKSSLFMQMQTTFYNRGVVIPKGDVQIRDDLNSVKKIVTTSEKTLFRAPHTADGHADRTTALALAIAAAKKATEPNNWAESKPAYSFCDENGWSIGRKYSPYCY